MNSESLKSFLKTMGVLLAMFLFVQFMVRVPALNGAAPLEPWDKEHFVTVTFTPIPEMTLPLPPYDNLSVQELWDYYQESNNSGDLEGAERMLAEAKSKANMLGINDPFFIQTKKEMAFFLLYRKGDFTQAINEFRYLLSALENAHGMASPLLVPDLQNLANTLSTANRFAEAEAYYKRAIDILVVQNPVDRVLLANINKDFGHWLQQNGRVEESMVQYESAIKLLDLPEDRVALKPIIDSYVVHLRTNNNFERAEQVEALVQ